MSDYVPPQNLDAEESIIGAMMLSSRAIDTASDIVGPEDFYRESHGRIFSAILRLSAQNEPVDAITLASELDRSGDLEMVGGKVRIHELAALVPAASNVGHYSQIVREQALRRKLIAAGQQIASLGVDGVGTLDELLGEAETHLTDATSQSYTSEFEQLGSGLDDFYAEVEQAVESGVPIFGLKTGFPDLDEKVLGLHPGTVTILAARPKVGKSMLAQNIAENVADAGTPAAIFSLEMSRRELQLRSVCRKTRIPVHLLRTGRINQEELQQFQRAVTAIQRRPLYIEDNPSITPTELRARARKLKRQYGLGLLVVDYLQLMVPGTNNSRDGRQNEIAAISRSLKVLAKELEIPVIALSQLNREVEAREDKRPRLADLRDSGAIEQDADVVMFLYREALYKQVSAENENDTELIIAASRMGEPATVKLLFAGKRQEFLSPARLTVGRAA